MEKKEEKEEKQKATAAGVLRGLAAEAKKRMSRIFLNSIPGVN